MFVGAEGEGKCIFGMGLPGQLQPLADPTPHPYLASPADGGPVLPAAADGQRRDDIEGLTQGALAHERRGKIRVLHLDFLQIGAPHG